MSGILVEIKINCLRTLLETRDRFKLAAGERGMWAKERREEKKW
jgi:hypothetical protein